MAQTTPGRSTTLGNGNTNCGNMNNCFNNFYTSDDAQIMHWLSPLNPGARHHTVRTNHIGGIGNWLLETGDFEEWRSGRGGGEKAVLFCSGDPGVGKTYLSSLVIDSLCDQANKEDIAVVGFYCDFAAQQEQTITNVMGAILKQLVCRGDIPNYIREAFQDEKKVFGGRVLALPHLMEMLKMAIAPLPQVFICIDALDEYLPKLLQELLKLLSDILRESPGTRIFLTGRPPVKENVQRYFASAVVIPIAPKTEDIRDYLKNRLDGDIDPGVMSDDLRVDIVRVILEKSSEIFLIVRLNIDTILAGETIGHRKDKLKEVERGNGLSDAYTKTLGRLQKGNKAALGMKVLMWVLYARRPLRAEEICHALGVGIESADLDFDYVPSVQTVLASCVGLVTVEASSSTVRLMHSTLQDYLLNDQNLFGNPHSTIAEVCLTYLNFGCFWDPPPNRDSIPPQMPLHEYSSCYWEEHARQGMTARVKALGLALLKRQAVQLGFSFRVNPG